MILGKNYHRVKYAYKSKIKMSYWVCNGMQTWVMGYNMDILVKREVTQMLLLTPSQVEVRVILNVSEMMINSELSPITSEIACNDTCGISPNQGMGYPEPSVFCSNFEHVLAKHLFA